MNNKEIRNYIEIASTMITENEQVVREDVILVEDTVPASIDTEIEEQINTLVFKLRSYRDPEPGAFADGVEAGMARAADMIENLLERLRGN